jgi:hypothetical protein
MSKVEVNQISSQCGSTLTIGQSGDTVTLAAGATQTGFGRTGTVDWDTTAKTASFTAVSGNGYFVNTTSGAITVTLPAGSGGSIVSLKDYANTWNTNNVTVAPNGTDKINGINANAVLSTQDQSVTLVYVDSTKGWRAVQDSTSAVDGAQYITATGGTITCCGDYKVHTFTGPGTFTVCSVGNAAGSNTVDYLVIAGGGAGGNGGGPGGGGGASSGGGGAGGFREGYNPGSYTASPLATTALPVTATGYPITVGAGGSAFPSPACGAQNNPGSNSVFSTITSTGGGAGGGWQPVPTANGLPGGSGGGAADTGNYCATFGLGNTPPVSPPQGQNGGPGTNPNGSGGGGGGAGGAGQQGTAAGPSGNGGIGGAGGTGSTSSINGTPTGRAGGGGGGAGGDLPLGPSGPGGPSSDGGGAGGAVGVNGTAGTTNTGGGGGGGGGNPGKAGAAGGSGIVIIRYKYQ